MSIGGEFKKRRLTWLAELAHAACDIVRDPRPLADEREAYHTFAFCRAYHILK